LHLQPANILDITMEAAIYLT